MEIVTAMNLVRSLHLGKSPETGEPLPSDSICLREDVRGALEVALEHLAGAANQKARQQSQPPNQGKPWSPAEDVQLASEFEQAIPEREMARVHGRSQWAITRRLERLGKVPATERSLTNAA